MFIAADKKTFSAQFLSLLVHLVIAGIFYLMQFFHLSPPKINSVISSSVRVDIVEMPKYTLQELKKMEQLAGESVEEDKIVPKQAASKDDLLVKKKKVNFTQLMQQLAQKKVEKSKVPTIKHKKRGFKLGALSGKLKQLVHSGNKIRAGSSLHGEGSKLSAEKFEQYLQQLPDIVRIHWKLPSYLLDKGLRCRVRIFLDASGKLVRSELLESSGEVEYDKRALKAIAAVGNFPVVPQEIVTKVIQGDIVLGFPL